MWIVLSRIGSQSIVHQRNQWNCSLLAIPDLLHISAVSHQLFGSPLQWKFYVLMESKGGKKKSSSSRSSLMYEAPLGYSIEDLRPAGGIKKFSAAYSNVCTVLSAFLLSILAALVHDLMLTLSIISSLAVHEEAILIAVSSIHPSSLETTRNFILIFLNLSG